VNASSLADGLEARVQLVQLRLELRLPPAGLTNHVAARVANVTIRRLEIICRLKSLEICRLKSLEIRRLKSLEIRREKNN